MNIGLSMTAPTLTATLTALALTLGILATAHSAGENEAKMKNLKSVDELKAQFNADAGKRRLLLLLSPT